MLLEDPTSCLAAKILSALLMVIIVVSTISFVLESMQEFRLTPEECSLERLTVESCEPQPFAIFHHLETVCIIIFTFDYVLRIGTVHAALPSECGLPSRRTYSGLSITFAYARQTLNLIDLFAIIPFYIEAAGGGGGGAAVLRVLRLVRVFRVLKVPKLRSCAEMFMDVGIDALPALIILIFMSTLTAIFFASCIFFSEGTQYSVDEEWLEEFPHGTYVRPSFDGYSQVVTPFRSIPYSFWWFFTTATTVGYGDDYPTTTGGRLVACAVFATGIILLAMPITIVGGSFSKYYEDWVKEFGDDSMMDLALIPSPREPEGPILDPPSPEKEVLDLLPEVECPTVPGTVPAPPQGVDSERPKTAWQ